MAWRASSLAVLTRLSLVLNFLSRITLGLKIWSLDGEAIVDVDSFVSYKTVEKANS